MDDQDQVNSNYQVSVEKLKNQALHSDISMISQFKKLNILLYNLHTGFCWTSTLIGTTDTYAIQNVKIT